MNNYRLIENQLKNHFFNYKQALVLMGARQVGKTTLLKKIFPNALYLLLDEQPVKNILESYSSANYRNLIGHNRQIFIDELHLLSDPGRAVKLLYDQFEALKIIITGSSSLHIKNKTSESMAGRAINYYLYPLTFGEFLYQKQIETTQPKSILSKLISQEETSSVRLYSIQDMLKNVLIYGQYPEMVNLPMDKPYLINLADKAIFKDILELNLIDNRSKALELLKILAYQIGNMLNYTEISGKLAISVPTVQRYIEIFEQSFLLYRLYPFSKNEREEIGKTPKIYFWDLGLRNALINNFDDINIRSDAGAMFENFIINEIKKEISYTNSDYQVNYWRIKSKFEVDLVLSNHHQLFGIEIKLNNGQITKSFTNRYPQAKTRLISSENFY